MKAIIICPICSWLSPIWTNNSERESAVKEWQAHRDSNHFITPIICNVKEKKNEQAI